MGKRKYRDTKFDEQFVGVVRSVLDAPALWELSPHACKLLIDLMSQFRGRNNGDLSMPWSIMSKRGWRSRTTLWRARNELVKAGFIYVTRMGRRPRVCQLVALTWFPLDVSPKFDPEALSNFKFKAYRRDLPLPTIKPKPDWTLPNGGRRSTQIAVPSPPGTH